jgi:hypothetical protein
VPEVSGGGLAGAGMKVARARMIIEFADGSARYFEAREPGTADIKLDTGEDVRRRVLGDDFMSAGTGMAVTDLARVWGCDIEGATLRLTWNPDYHLTIERDSGEIPPELAEAAAGQIEEVLLWHVIADRADNPLARLKPYLARIAGKP